MHEASRQFDVNPMGPQAVICLKTLPVRKYLYTHEETLIALNAEEIYDLSCTLRKPFLSTSRLRSDSGKIEDHIHSLTWARAQMPENISLHANEGPPMTAGRNKILNELIIK